MNPATKSKPATPQVLSLGVSEHLYSRDMYQYFMRQHGYIPYQDYFDICVLFNESLVRRAAEGATMVILPLRVGYLSVVRSKINYALKGRHKPQLNRRLTQEKGFPVYCLNEHTGGYKFTLKWERGHFLKNKRIFTFSSDARARAVLNDWISRTYPTISS